MRLRGDCWHLRLMGCLFGIGALVLGLAGVLGDVSGIPFDHGQRVDFSVIAIVTGLIALIGSLVTPDIRGLWYCNPERSSHARITAKEAAMGMVSLEALDGRSWYELSRVGDPKDRSVSSADAASRSRRR